MNLEVYAWSLHHLNGDYPQLDTQLRVDHPPASLPTQCHPFNQFETPTAFPGPLKTKVCPALSCPPLSEFDMSPPDGTSEHSGMSQELDSAMLEAPTTNDSSVRAAFKSFASPIPLSPKNYKAAPKIGKMTQLGEAFTSGQIFLLAYVHDRILTVGDIKL
ncbi:hypothetical protein CROQUDRAFT_89497 [Cronartium quercuum f. sp. fusiforme G11]|uniref:Uncharacterized protein n=1 Tax=Cronartium quercuum f. sp. fusiforme G11 TaxID=708437 RepID=A0A9P6TET3_9BASI|nr:hypothetical protein CROQUDRAFT_89497 [Cronartium quercuum f. sp. fusiforme G11]